MEPWLAWKSLGRLLPAELQGTSSHQPWHSFVLSDPSVVLEPKAWEGWSSSLLQLGQNMLAALPCRVSHGGELGARSPLPTPPYTEGKDARAHRVLYTTAGLFLEPLGNDGRGTQAPSAGC